MSDTARMAEERTRREVWREHSETDAQMWNPPVEILDRGRLREVMLLAATVTRAGLNNQVVVLVAMMESTEYWSSSLAQRAAL